MPEISVIVPVYNVEQYLKSCIDSILNQTFTDFELILVDDGSTDNSGAICDEYAQIDERIRVIHQKNQGQAAARNHAIKESKAPWLVFVDSDDVIHLQMLEILYRTVEQNSVDMVMCWLIEGDSLSESFFEAKQPCAIVETVNETFFERISNEKNTGIGIATTKIIDRSIVEKHLFTEGKVYEDNAVVCEWICEAKSVAYIKEFLYFYRINPEGTTKSPFSEKHLDQLWAFEQQINCYRKYGYPKMASIICDSYMWTAYDLYLRSINELERNDLARLVAKQTRRMYKQNKDAITLTQEQIDYIMGTLFPRRIPIVGKWKTIFERIKMAHKR